MTSDATPAPGSMTVPPLFGWEALVVGLVLAVLIGVAYLVLSAVSGPKRPSTDWDAFLDGRSRNRRVVPATGDPAGLPSRGTHPGVGSARSRSGPRG